MKTTEDNIKELADKVMMNYLTDGNIEGDFKHSTVGADDNKHWWVAGYKQAKQETMFTLEDMNQAVFIGMRNSTTPEKAAIDLDNYIKVTNIIS